MLGTELEYLKPMVSHY